MEPWVAASTDRLWDFALAAIPLTLVVAVATRWLPCRPATRHTLWVTVLAFLIASPFLPQAPSLTPVVELVRHLATTASPAPRDGLAAEPMADDAEVPASGSESPERVASYGSRIPSYGGFGTPEAERLGTLADRIDAAGPPAAHTLHPTVRRSVARPRPQGGPDAPNRLAQATGSGGPLAPRRDDRGNAELADSCPAAPRADDAALYTCPADSSGGIAPHLADSGSPLPAITTKRRIETPARRSTPGRADSAGAAPARQTARTEARGRNAVEAVTTGRSERQLVAANEPARVAAGVRDSGVLPVNAPSSNEPRSAAWQTIVSRAGAAWVAWAAGVVAVEEAIAGLPAFPASLWLAGSSFLALWLLVRMARVRRLISSASPAPASVKRMVGVAAAALGMRRVPETLLVDRRVSPMILCGRRARLILPRELWSQLDDTGRRAVIYHELAHVRRRDHWVFWVDALVGLVYWWYPLVWWVRSRLHAEAELCCDAWVTSLMPRERRAYAEALLHTKEYLSIDNHSMPVGGMGITTGRAARFGRRLTMVMTGSTRPGLSASGIALALTVAVTGWLATPVRSCPPKDEAVNAAPCAVSGTALAVAPAGGAAPAGAVAVAPALAVSAAPGAAAPVAFAGAAKVGAVVALGGACEKCKPGKPCKACAKAHAKQDCDCPDCKEGKPCPKCAHSFVVGGEGGATFLPHLARKGQPGFAPFAWKALPPGDFGQLMRVGFDDKDMERRLRDLEERLEQLGERLARIADAVAQGHGRAAPDDDDDDTPRARARGIVTPRPPREPRAPRAPRAPRTPHADGATPPPPGAPVPPAPPEAPEPRVPRGIGPDDGEQAVEVYHLPDGKREALTALMVRSDVPVLVRPLDDGIEVHGTRQQQRVFRAFVDMINAVSDGRSDATPEPDAEGIASEHFARAMEEHARQMAVESEGIRESVAKAMRAGAGPMKAHREQMAKHRDTLRKELQKMHKQAEKARERAEKVREKADRLRSEAESLQQETADDTDDEHRTALEARYAEALAMVSNVEQEAAVHESEAEMLESQAEQLESQADELEAEQEAIEEQAEEAAEQAAQEAAEAAEPDDPPPPPDVDPPSVDEGESL